MQKPLFDDSGCYADESDIVMNNNEISEQTHIIRNDENNAGKSNIIMDNNECRAPKRILRSANKQTHIKRNDDNDADESDNSDVNTQTGAIKLPIILVFDSLGVKPRLNVIATLRDYLNCEYRAKMPDAPRHVYNTSNMRVSCPEVPRQHNLTDCGVFLLQYAENFFKDPITDYRPDLNKAIPATPARVFLLRIRCLLSCFYVARSFACLFILFLCFSRLSQAKQATTYSCMIASLSGTHTCIKSTLFSHLCIGQVCYRLPITQLSNWFDQLTVARKREDIALLLRTLISEQNQNLKNVKLPQIKFPTLNGVLL